MKAPMFKINHLTINYLSEPPAAPTAQLTQDREAFYGQSVASGLMPKFTPPAIGEYWPGQGGVYGGRREYPEGLCYVVFAAADVGKHAYGEYGVDVEATSHIDGRENAAILVNRDGSHPAAEAACTYTCDGHADFYLPAAGELYHGYQYLPESFEEDWYVSSTQRSAYHAFGMTFDDGSQDSLDKVFELRVRPVRRFLR